MKKKYIPVDCQVLLTPSFKADDDFADLVNDFLGELPTYFPTHWGVVEPIGLELTVPELRDFLCEGGNEIMWKRKTPPKGWGVFRKRTYPLRGPQLASHALEVSANNARQVQDVASYIKHLVTQFGVEYAICDSMTEPYKSVGFANGVAPFASNFMIPTHRLMRCLPDIVWAQIFGPAYVKLIGLDKLLSAPAHKVEQLGPETVYVQLSESLFDMHDRYEEVDAVRQQVKQHLDDNIFFDPRNAKEHVYRVPQFEFPD